MTSIELVRGVLSWAPELGQCSEDIVDALDLCCCDGQRAVYCVEHYSPKAVGQTFGPLALDQTLWFCHRLAARLEDRTSGRRPLVVTSPQGDWQACTNSCVLVGAYLVLCQQWTAKQVAEVLGQEAASLKFPCSWSNSRSSEASWVMQVAFCWEGLEMAFRCGWIDLQCLHDEAYLTSFCDRYRLLVSTYDSACIIPGKLMISADPTTTAYDPNPGTFSRMWCSAEEADMPSRCVSGGETVINGKLSETADDLSSEGTAEHPSIRAVPSAGPRPRKGAFAMCSGDTSDAGTDEGQKIVAGIDDGPLLTKSALTKWDRKQHRRNSDEASVSSNSTETERRKVSYKCTRDGDFERQPSYKCVSDDDFERQPSSVACSLCSLDTVCKEFSIQELLPRTITTLSTETRQSKTSFVRFLKKSEVGIVIRCNFSDEQGMPAPSYDGEKLEDFGIRHHDMQIVDRNGGLPDPSTIVDLLDVCNGQSGAVLIHCKGGFGRSVVLGCVWAIHAYDVPGQALLAWMRLVRPGAVTTRLQELFLVSFKGRQDVKQFINKTTMGATKTGCVPGCILQ